MTQHGMAWNLHELMKQLMTAQCDRGLHSSDEDRTQEQALLAQAVSAQQKALISSPIKSLVCKHAGAVHAISASPFDPRLVISCGLDGQVRLCSSLIRQPLLEVAPSASYLFSVQWSPTRPMLFAVGAGELVKV